MKVKKKPKDDFYIQITLSKNEAFRLCQLLGVISGLNPKIREPLDRLYLCLSDELDYKEEHFIRSANVSVTNWIIPDFIE